MERRPHRTAVIVGRSLSPISELLVEAICRASSSFDDLRIAAICDSSRLSGLAQMREGIVGFLDPFARKAFNAREYIHWPRARGFRRLARRYSVPLLSPLFRDLNHPDFVQYLRKELKPEFVFSCFCPQLFKRPLLETFSEAVNYHNGLLPHYRGLRATAWSIYNDEAETGFTFHRMNEKFDEGPILYSDSIPIEPDVSCRELSLRKTRLACESVPKILQMVLNGEKGRPQSGQAGYFSAKDFRRITTICDPERFTHKELLRRLRAFEVLRMELGGEFYEVTRLDEVAKPVTPLCFCTADGVHCRPARFKFLPRWTYGAYVLIKGAFPCLKCLSYSFDVW